MTLTLIAILFGAGLGGLVPAMWAWYFVGTREYRRAKSLLIFGLGYIFILGTSVGSLLLLTRVLEGIGVGRRSSQRDAAVYAYTASFICGVFLVARGEIRWRRSVGLHDKTLLSTKRKE
jgi:hypothetical protein